MHRKRGKDEHKYFILPSPQSFNSAPSDLYRWSTMFETSSDNTKLKNFKSFSVIRNSMKTTPLFLGSVYKYVSSLPRYVVDVISV